MSIQRVRVIDLETAGDGPQDVCEIGWQDVSLGLDGRWHVTDERGASLVNPGRAISTETMAVRAHLQARLRRGESHPGCQNRHARPAGMVRPLQRASPAQVARISFTPRVHRGPCSTVRNVRAFGGYNTERFQMRYLERASRPINLELGSITIRNNILLIIAPSGTLISY